MYNHHRLLTHYPRLFASLLFCIFFVQGSPSIAQTTKDGIFSLDQAVSGRAIYQDYCVTCHRKNLDGGEFGAALTGMHFRGKWEGQSLLSILDKMKSTMPPSDPGGLNSTQYLQLLSYILIRNNYPPGNLDLKDDDTSLANIYVTSSTKRFDAQTLIDQRLSEIQVSGPTVEWLYNRSDANSTNYSPLDIINRDNIDELEIAWRWRSDNFGAKPLFNYQATPIMANGRLFTTAGKRRVIVAIDPSTGETLWMYRLDEGKRGEAAPRKNAGRGVAYWRDDNNFEAVYAITPGYNLVALDPATGRPIQRFGNDGIVDLKKGLVAADDLVDAPIGSSSPPIVVNGVLVVGAAFPPGFAPPKKSMIPGHIRGYDARTGEQLWVFHSIPKAEELGNDTWKNNSWRYTGNVGAWAPLSGDPKLGYVYLPMEAATGDFYGGHRPGDNLFSQSLVCLDVKTGKRVWHYQLIHHGIWDYDLPAAPVLLDIKVDNRKIPAIAQVTKQGFTYVFDRRNGKPVWPIVERPVPQSTIPGEQTSATQPFPSLPKPFERQGIGHEDLIDFTEEIFTEAKRIASQYQMGPLYTPPSLLTSEHKGTLMLPAPAGGANWQGAVADPETGILYVPSTTIAFAAGLIHEPERSEMRYIFGSETFVKGPYGLPLVKPPWGRITAINLNSGNHLWMVANGDTPQKVRNHKKLDGVLLPRTGHDERVGLLVTKTFLFAGEGAGLNMASQGGNMFRAHDKSTGEILAEIKLPANQSGIPMTYSINGKQFIVVAVGGSNHPGELVALTVPTGGIN